jgi:hypothetical protein
MCLLWGTNSVLISQNTTFFVVTAVKTSNLTQTFGFNNIFGHSSVAVQLGACQEGFVVIDSAVKCLDRDTNRWYPDCTFSLSLEPTPRPGLRGRQVGRRLRESTKTLFTTARGPIMANAVPLICLLLQKSCGRPLDLNSGKRKEIINASTRQRVYGWEDRPEGLTKQQWKTGHKFRAWVSTKFRKFLDWTESKRFWLCCIIVVFNLWYVYRRR